MTGLNAGEDVPGWVVFTWPLTARVAPPHPITADDLQPILWCSAAQEMRLIHSGLIVALNSWSDLLGCHVGVRADVLRGVLVPKIETRGIPTLCH